MFLCTELGVYKQIKSKCLRTDNRRTVRRLATAIRCGLSSSGRSWELYTMSRFLYVTSHFYCAQCILWYLYEFAIFFVLFFSAAAVLCPMSETSNMRIFCLQYPSLAQNASAFLSLFVAAAVVVAAAAAVCSPIAWHRSKQMRSGCTSH